MPACSIFIRPSRSSIATRFLPRWAYLSPVLPQSTLLRSALFRMDGLTKRSRRRRRGRGPSQRDTRVAGHSAVHICCCDTFENIVSVLRSICRSRSDGGCCCCSPCPVCLPEMMPPRAALSRRRRGLKWFTMSRCQQLQKNENGPFFHAPPLHYCCVFWIQLDRIPGII